MKRSIIGCLLVYNLLDACLFTLANSLLAIFTGEAVWPLICGAMPYPPSPIKSATESKNLVDCLRSVMKQEWVWPDFQRLCVNNSIFLVCKCIAPSRAVAFCLPHHCIGTPVYSITLHHCFGPQLLPLFGALVCHNELGQR